MISSQSVKNHPFKRKDGFFKRANCFALWRFVKPEHCREDAKHRNDCEAGVVFLMSETN